MISPTSKPFSDPKSSGPCSGQGFPDQHSRPNSLFLWLFWRWILVLRRSIGHIQCPDWLGKQCIGTEYIRTHFADLGVSLFWNFEAYFAFRVHLEIMTTIWARWSISGHQLVSGMVSLSFLIEIEHVWRRFTWFWAKIHLERARAYQWFKFLFRDQECSFATQSC